MPSSQFNFKEYLTEHPELYEKLDLANKTEDEWIVVLKNHYDNKTTTSDCNLIGPAGPMGPCGPPGPAGQEGPSGKNGVVDYSFVPIYTSSNNIVVDLRENSNINYAVYAPALGNKDLNVDILHDDTCIGKKGNIVIAHWDNIDLSRVQTVPDIMIEKENRFLCIGPNGTIDYCYEVGSDLIENKNDDDNTNDIECVVFQNDIKLAISGSNSRRIPVYNYDFSTIKNQRVTYNYVNKQFYLDPNSVLENLSLQGEKWFFQQNVKKTITKIDTSDTFTIENQWYYLDNDALTTYVKSYINSHKNDLCYLEHTNIDIVNQTGNLIYCVPIEGEPNKNYRKIRLENIDIPLKAFEKLSQEIDDNANYSGNVDIVLKGAVDFKIMVGSNDTEVEILKIGSVTDHSVDQSNGQPKLASVTWKKYSILKAYKNNCAFWSFYDMSVYASSRDLDFDKFLILNRMEKEDNVDVGKWNKVLEVVVRPNYGSSPIKNMQFLNVFENGNDLNVVTLNNTIELQNKLKVDNASVAMTHYTYSVDMYNTIGDSSKSLPKFVARMNNFYNKNGNVLSVKLGSVLKCRKEFGNNRPFNI